MNPLKSEQTRRTAEVPRHDGTVNTAPEEGAWILGPPPGLAHLPRLYCFANAGGSAEAFRLWQSRLTESLAVCPVELPGRGRRTGEDFCATLTQAAAAAAAGISAAGRQPYCLFGHSLGSVLALETARALARLGHPPARCVFLSGRVAPHICDESPRLHAGSDAELIAEMRRLGGTQEELLADPAFLEFFLPIVRDDYRLLETYTPSVAPKISAPIHVCCGDADADAPPALLRHWDELSDASCRITLFPGGHFYINTEQDALLSYIGQTYRACA
jgi:medium-chain acyl-[acyl-carrier-protein] hydrolase